MSEQVDVFGWLADRQGCGTIRVMQPLETLELQTGIITDYDERLSARGYMPKVIVGQRVCKDEPTRLWQYLASIQGQRPKLVFELDDDLWNIDPTNAAAFEWFNNGFDRRSRTFHDVQGNLAANIHVADRVTVTTQALANIVSQWSDNVVIVPNRIPEWVLDWERPKRDRLTIGWMGSATHAMDWDQAGDQVARFVRRNPEVEGAITRRSRNSPTNTPHRVQLVMVNTVPTAPCGDDTVSASTSSRKMTPAAVTGTSIRSAMRSTEPSSVVWSISSCGIAAAAPALSPARYLSWISAASFS